MPSSFASCAEIDSQGDLRGPLQARTTLSDVLVPAGLRVESVRNQREAGYGREP